MKVVFNCVNCGSADISKKIGRFAQFMAYRMFDYPREIQTPVGPIPPALMTNAATCRECGFVFSQLRPDADELSRVYQGYRTEDYVRDRSFFEPGYRKIHPLIGDGGVEIEVRQAAANGFLRDVVDVSSIKRVLDYGGDRGQHIPAMFAKCERLVYEISDSVVVPGVRLIKSLRDVEDVDFVIAANVMEHVSYPMEIMREIKSVCHKDTMVFLDVPLEMKDDADVDDSGNPVLFHEHINYFTTRSLTALIERSGFSLLKVARIPLDLGWQRATALYALARRDQ